VVACRGAVPVAALCQGIISKQLGEEASCFDGLDEDEYVELMATMEEELRASVAAEQEAEFLAREAAEEARLQEMLTEEGVAGAVPCPICSRGTLFVSPEGCVACSCYQAQGSPFGGAPAGFEHGCMLRLDACGVPAPLELLRERMCRLLEEHGRVCQRRPSCRLPLPGETLGMLVFECDCGVRTGVV